MPKRYDKPQTVYSRLLPYGLIVAGLVVLVVAISWMSWSTGNRAPKLATREGVAKLASIVSNIQATLEGTDEKWQETSSCTVVEPRKFGDKEEYYCNVEYERTRLVTSQIEIKAIVDKNLQGASNLEYIEHVGHSSYPELGIDEGVKSVGGSKIFLKEVVAASQMCALEYRLTGEINKQSLRERIRCYVDTDGAHLSQIKKV